MKRWIPALTACLAAMLPVSSQTNPDAGELTHPHSSRARAERALSEWRAEHGSSWRMRYDDTRGQARFLFGGASAPLFEPTRDADFFSLARRAMEQTADFHAVDASTLVESRVRFIPLGTIGSTDKMSVEFRQAVDGVPVVQGCVNALFDVRGRLLALDIQAQPNLAGFATRPSLGSRRAGEIADAHFRRETGLPATQRSQPKLVIHSLERDGLRIPMLSWSVELTHHLPDTEPVGWRYFIDGFLGNVLAKEPTVHHFDVSGTLTSNVSPGTAPDQASNPPQPQPIPHLRVTNNQNGNVVYTDANGFFNIPGATPGVQATFVYDGLFTTTNNNAGADYSLTRTLTQSSGNSVLMNPTPTQFITAQANSANWVHLLRDHTRAVDPGDDAMDRNWNSNVNINSNCSAFYNGSINFFQQGSGCPNTAYSSVVCHEVGHGLNVIYGTGNGSDGIGEGIADVFAMYTLDDPVVGRDLFGPGQHRRTGENTRQFCGDCCPGCYGEVHDDGEVIMGAMWKVRRNLKNTHGASAGSAIADGLFSGWNNVYNQTQIKNIIVEQWITLDDDDGNTGNGSPNYNDINDAFREQGFPGFDLDAIQFANVTQLPDTLDESGPYTVDADITALINPPITSASLRYSVDGGAFQTVAMTGTGGDSFTGDIPGQSCPADVRYYVEAADSGGISETFPGDAPATTLDFRVSDVTVVLEDDFEMDKGWTAVNNGASSGDWQRGVPVDDPGWEYDPASDSDGSGQCFLTQNENGNTDVDDGSVTLTSPAFDLAGVNGAEISYDYFLRLTNTGEDFLVVEISSNGNAGPWTTVVSHGTDGGLSWRSHVITAADMSNAGITLTADMRVRFTANDSNPQSICESALDAFRVIGASCEFDCTDPIVYCTPKPGLLCGLPAIGWSGQSSAGSTSGFEVFASPARGLKAGLVLYGNAGEAAIPFQGGTLCVNPAPLYRTDAVGSGGTQGTCDGEFRIDLNAFASGQLGGNPQPFLQQVGQIVNIQWWGRDTVQTGSFLSDAIEYVVCP